MQITIELKPQTEMAVRASAAAQGMEVEDYLRRIVENASMARQEQLSIEEFERDWNAFCKPVKGLPENMDLSREAIYGDHD